MTLVTLFFLAAGIFLGLVWTRMRLARILARRVAWRPGKGVEMPDCGSGE